MMVQKGERNQKWGPDCLEIGSIKVHMKALSITEILSKLLKERYICELSFYA